MDFLSKDEVKKLIEINDRPCVSLYMPTAKMGSETQQNPIRFKNLMSDVEAKLEATGIRLSDAAEWLEPAKKLDRQDFWEHQENGLAIFVSPNEFRYYRVPIAFEEWVALSDRFHLKPLLPLMTHNGRYFILTLSQDNVRLIEASQYNAREIYLENLPENLDKALLYDETAKTGQFRIFTSHGGTNNPAGGGVFHGQGSPDRDKFHRDILQYFHQVNDGIYNRLKEEEAPLVLACVEYLMPLYHEANTYPHLLENGIAGNPKLLKPDELKNMTWEIVQPLFDRSYEQAVDRYHQLIGSEETSKAFSEIEEIVSAAYYQRLDSLFVAVDRHQWGHFDPETNTVEIHDEAQPNDEDLLDFAAVYTFLNGGTVYAEPKEKVPGEVPAAAIARF